jgi:integrase
LSIKHRGVCQTPDGRYYIKYRPGRNPSEPTRTSEYFGRGSDALLRAAARYEELHDRRKRYDPIGITFAELANRYIEARIHDLSRSDADAWYWKMRAIIFPAIGDTEVARLGHDRLDEYRRKRTADGVKQVTIHRELSYIRAILNWGVRRRLIGSSPMAGYQMPRKDSQVVRPISDDEFERILQHAAPHVRRAMLVAANTGLRPGAVELLTLTWDAFDERAKVMRIISARKGGLDSREVPLLDSFIELLKKWRDEDGGNGYIVHWHGRRIKTSLKTAWKAAKKRAGVQGRVRPYSIRHRFVTRLLDAGADLKSVSEIVGHKDVNMTIKVYQESSSQSKRKTIELLGELLPLSEPKK